MTNHVKKFEVIALIGGMLCTFVTTKHTIDDTLRWIGEHDGVVRQVRR